MKLKQPLQLKEKLMKTRDLLTIADVAKALRMSNHTVAKALRGEPVRANTIKKLAEALELKAGDIATFAD